MTVSFAKTSRGYSVVVLGEFGMFKWELLLVSCFRRHPFQGFVDLQNDVQGIRLDSDEF